MDGTIEPRPDRISLDRYVRESAFITRYLSRVVKDKALVVYQVLFHLSWFETGRGEIEVPWARVGSFIRSEQGNIIDNSTTVKRRLSDLFEYECIAVAKQRGNANMISVHLPSDISACQDLIAVEERATHSEPEEKDQRDYYNDPDR